MPRICQITGKRPVVGNVRSHALNATKRRFLPNLHTHRFWIESEKRFVTLCVSANGMRVIDKKGIDNVLTELRFCKKSAKPLKGNKSCLRISERKLG